MKYAEPITGRVLYMSQNPQIIEHQLAQGKVIYAHAGELRNEISTDEITPIPILGNFDRRLGRFPYTGLVAGGKIPIPPDKVRECGLVVVVAGNRYGKGSSREHSPLAELLAGVRLVIAKSFERIYRQNADNIGLFTSTDLELLSRIDAGEPISMDELLVGRDGLAAAVLSAGGLLRYGKLRLAVEAQKLPEHDDFSEFVKTPRTFFEKVVAKHAVGTLDTSMFPLIGEGGFVRADWRFIHEYYTGMCAHLLDEAFGGDFTLRNPETILAFEDHLAYLKRSAVHIKNGLIPSLQGLINAHRTFVQRFEIRSHGALETEGSEGIAHALMAERYALPGHIVVGTDSHTTHSGALGCVAFGVGTTDMANAMVTGLVRLTVPESIRIVLTGKLVPGLCAKDIALYVLADPRVRQGACVGRAIEFSGTVVGRLSTDDRATLTNMAAELGGFTGLIVPDSETKRFLRERRGIDFELEPWMFSDPEATYADTLEFDCSSMEPIVAHPGDPGHGIKLSELPSRPKIDIAYGGSCTAGKRNDFDRYHEVLSWAAEHGFRVADGVSLYLQFGTTDVRDYCLAKGYIKTFESVGAELLQPSCGACANCGPGASTSASQVTISAINRNFPGRSGPGRVWLASPATVAASAIAGVITSFGELIRFDGQMVMKEKRQLNTEIGI